MPIPLHLSVARPPLGQYYSKVTGNTSYDRGPGMTSWLEQCGMGKTDVSPDCFEGCPSRCAAPPAALSLSVPASATVTACGVQGWGL